MSLWQHSDFFIVERGSPGSTFLEESQNPEN